MIAFALVLLTVALPLLAAYLIGRNLPREHQARESRRIPAPRERVFDSLSRSHQWRPDIEKWEDLGIVDGKPRWREQAGERSWVTYELIESNRPLRRVTRIVGDNLPFGGTWTFRLASFGHETEVEIVEDGYVEAPVLRTIARYVIGHNWTLHRFLDHLEKHAKENPHGA